MQGIWESTGLANGDWQQYVMILVAFVLLYLAIVKGFEPLLLLPISFGMLLANLPLGGLMDDPTFKYFATLQEAQQYAAPLRQGSDDGLQDVLGRRRPGVHQ